METLIKTKATPSPPIPLPAAFTFPRNINTCNTIYAQGARFTKVPFCLCGRILHFGGSFGEGKANNLHFFHLSKILFEWEQWRLQWGWTISTSHRHSVISSSSRSLKHSARQPEASEKIIQSRRVGRECNSTGNFQNWWKWSSLGIFWHIFIKTQLISSGFNQRQSQHLWLQCICSQEKKNKRIRAKCEMLSTAHGKIWHSYFPVMMRQLPLPPARAVSSFPVCSPCLCIHLLSPVSSVVCQLSACALFDYCTLLSKAPSLSRPTALGTRTVQLVCYLHCNKGDLNYILAF